MREVIAEYTAEDVYSTKRSEVQDKIRQRAEAMMGEKMMTGGESEDQEENAPYRIPLNALLNLIDTLILGIELPKAARTSRHLHRPLRPPRWTDADPRASGARNGHDRFGSGLCDAGRLGPCHRGARPADPGLLGRRRARRGLGLLGRDRDTGAQGLLRQLAIRQPAGRSDFRRGPWRAAERDHPSRVDDGMGLAYPLPHRLPYHSAPVHSAQLPAGNRRVRATPARGQPSPAAEDPAAVGAELADRDHRHAARNHDDGLVLFHHRLYPDLWPRGAQARQYRKPSRDAVRGYLQPILAARDGRSLRPGRPPAGAAHVHDIDVGDRLSRLVMAGQCAFLC